MENRQAQKDIEKEQVAIKGRNLNVLRNKYYVILRSRSKTKTKILDRYLGQAKKSVQYVGDKSYLTCNSSN